jgi:DNA polymerase-3 subunit delta'
VEVASPLGHAATVERLLAAARSKRLPHALVFEGPEGIGKFLAARWFAMGCVCVRGPAAPCGSCGPCRRVASGGERGNHPDVFLIDPVLEGQERILVGRIAQREHEGEQSLEAFLDLRPLEAELRPVLVREAHRMNVQAQNALLKTLEEPRAGTVIVLETHRPSALLPTILSRCVRIRFDPLDAEECAAVLAAHGLASADARELARLAAGSPGRALAMARDGTREIRALLVAVASGARDPLAASGELWELEGELPGKTQTARERERARTVLDLAQALVSDALRLAAGRPADALAHGDVAGTRAARAGERDLAGRAVALLQVRADIERNLAPAALVERALLVLAQGAASARPA